MRSGNPFWVFLSTIHAPSGPPLQPSQAAETSECSRQASEEFSSANEVERCQFFGFTPIKTRKGCRWCLKRESAVKFPFAANQKIEEVERQMERWTAACSCCRHNIDTPTMPRAFVCSNSHCRRHRYPKPFRNNALINCSLTPRTCLPASPQAAVMIMDGLRH